MNDLEVLAERLGDDLPTSELDRLRTVERLLRNVPPALVRVPDSLTRKVLDDPLGERRATAQARASLIGQPCL